MNSAVSRAVCQAAVIVLSVAGLLVLAPLPTTTAASVVTGDQSAVFYFDPVTAKFDSIFLSGILTAPVAVSTVRPADQAAGFSPLDRLEWDAVPLAFGYRVYFGADAVAVAAATVVSPEYKGETENAFQVLPPAATPPGTDLFWRVDAVGYDATEVAGTVKVFHSLPVTLPGGPVSFTTVQSGSVVREKVPTGGVSGAPWTVSAISAEWLKVARASGVAGEDMEFDFEPGKLTQGDYTGSITMTCGPLACSFEVTLKVEPQNFTAMKADPERPVIYAFQRSVSGQCWLLNIGTGDGRIEKMIPLAAEPSAMDLTPDGRYLFIFSGAGRQVLRFDLTDGSQVVRSLPVAEGEPQGFRPLLAAAVGESRVFWVDGLAVSRLHELDFAAGVEKGSALSINGGAGVRAVARNSTGSTLVLGNAENQAWLLETGESRKLSGPFGQSRSWWDDPLLTMREDDSAFFLGTVKFSFPGAVPLKEYPSPVSAATRTHGLLFGTRAAWRENSLKRVWMSPGSLDMGACAVAGDQSAFFYFNPWSAELIRVPMKDLGDVPGPEPEDGEAVNAMPSSLTWTPVPGALRYEVYFGTDPAGVGLAADVASPFHQGTATEASLPFNQPFTMAGLWWWRVDTVLPGGTVKGQVWKFSGGLQFVAALLNADGASRPAVLALDQTTLLAGCAPLRNDSPYSPGRVFVYGKVPGREDWSREQVLHPPSESVGREFGSALALKGDVAWISATQAEAGSQVLEYRRDPVTRQWSPTGRRLASDIAGDEFGQTVAYDGTLVVVSAPGSWQIPATQAGRVEVYDGESLRKITTLLEPAPAWGGYGSGLALGGGVIAVSSGRSTWDSGNGNWRYGEVDVWTSTGADTWSRSAALAPSLSKEVQYFGAIPAVAGNEVLAGSTFANRDLEGKLYSFERGADQVWRQNGIVDASMGTDLPVSPNANAACGDLLVTGAPVSDLPNQFVSNVWLHRRIPGAGWIPVAPVVPPTGSMLRQMGQKVALSDRYLVADHSPYLSNERGVTVYLHNPAANLNPVPTSSPKPFAETGVPYESALTARDDNAGDTLQFAVAGPLPGWLRLTDHGDGSALLSGTPPAHSAGVIPLRLTVKDQAGGTGELSFNLTVLPAAGLPSVSGISGGGTVDDGERVELSVTDPGGGAAFQWYQGDLPLEGETRSHLIFGRVQAGNTGSYHVRVTNGGAWADSASVALTVNQAANRFGGDWPTFGAGNSHNGAYPATLGRHKFLPAWTKTGAGKNQVATGNGRLFTTSSDYFDSNAGSVKAWEPATGQLLWNHPLPDTHETGPPTFHRGRVFARRTSSVWSAASDLRGLDTTTGGLVWKSEVLTESQNSPWVMVADDAVYTLTGSGMQVYDPAGNILFKRGLAEGTMPLSHEGNLYASISAFSMLDRNSGWPVYSLEPFLSLGATWAMPVASGDTAVYVNNGKLQAVDLEKLVPRWSSDGIFRGVPALKNDVVYVVGTLEVRSFDASTGGPLRNYALPELEGEVPTLNLLQPIILDDSLIVSSKDWVWVFDLKTGARLQKLTGGGPVVYSDGMLFASGTDQVLRAWRLNQPAVLTPPAEPLTAFPGVPVDWSVQVSDPDGDGLSIHATGLPAWLRMSALPESGVVRFLGTPLTGSQGAFAFTLSANDGQSFSTALEIGGTVVPPGDPLTVAAVGAPVWNAETGLWEQTVTVRNPGSGPIGGFELEITGLPGGAALYNGSGSGISGAATGTGRVIRSQTLTAGSSVSVVLEYLAPAAAAGWSLQFAAGTIAPASSPGPQAGINFQIDRAELSAPGVFLLEFPADPGAHYVVQRLGANGTWTALPPRLQAAGTRVQWHGEAPASAPDGKSRFYRVQRLSQP